MPARTSLDAAPTLLLIRPEPDSRRFAEMLPEYRAVISPILRIVPVPHDAARLAEAGGLVFTSAHGVSAAGPGRGRIALCVGTRTAEVAQAAGFDARAGNGFAESLLPMIAAAKVPLIHPHGRHLAKTLPVSGVVVYDQLAMGLSDEARALLDSGVDVALPLFSPRSARLMSESVAGARARLGPVAISNAVAANWSGPGHVVVAAQPDITAMAAAIRGLKLQELS